MLATKKTGHADDGRNRRAGDEGEAGFTLVELLVVLAIIALIGTLVGPRVLGYVGTARADTASVQIRNLANATELFFLDVGTYPGTEEGLGALVSPGSARGWNGPYLKSGSGLNDPWDRPFLYTADGGSYVISSLGRDGKAGGEGEDADITSAGR